MISNIDGWMNDLVSKLTARFDNRLLFVGLQGSYGRGEATEQSDVDAVIVLKSLSAADLDACREIAGTMEGRPCGFICGVEVLKAWPGYDLYTLYYDTRPYYGSLEGIARFTQEDVAQAVRIGAANLYHAAVHAKVFESGEEAGLIKALFFVLRDAVFLKHGVYAPNRAGLARLSQGEDLAMARLCQNAPRCEKGALEAVIEWSASLLRDIPSSH